MEAVLKTVLARRSAQYDYVIPIIKFAICGVETVFSKLHSDSYCMEVNIGNGLTWQTSF